MSTPTDLHQQLRAIHDELGDLARRGSLTADDWARLYLDAVEAAPGRDTESLENFVDPAWEAQVPAALKRVAEQRQKPAAE